MGKRTYTLPRRGRTVNMQPEAEWSIGHVEAMGVRYAVAYTVSGRKLASDIARWRLPRPKLNLWALVS